jgi:hypothetical protein
MSRSRFARTTASRPAARRYLAGALALFALLGQFANLAHLAVAQHAVCPEHGELVHSDQPGRRNPLVSLTESLTTALRPSGEAASKHSHDHCGIATQRREALLLAPPSAERVRLPAALATDWLPERQPRFAGQAVFRFAPKCSPPA